MWQTMKSEGQSRAARNLSRSFVPRKGVIAADALNLVSYAREGEGWVFGTLPVPPLSLPRPVDVDRIEARASGSEALWDGYASEIFVRRMTARGLILFDDIDFSDDMASCWRTKSHDPRIAASATVGRRLGIVELGPADRLAVQP
jgi:hypothetical protein